MPGSDLCGCVRWLDLPRASKHEGEPLKHALATILTVLAASSSAVAAPVEDIKVECTGTIRDRNTLLLAEVEKTQFTVKHDGDEYFPTNDFMTQAMPVLEGGRASIRLYRHYERLWMIATLDSEITAIAMTWFKTTPLTRPDLSLYFGRFTEKTRETHGYLHCTAAE
jgi:hypothetical protein